MGIEFSDFNAEDVTLSGHDFCQLVENIIGGIPTVVEVRVMLLFTYLTGILFQSSVLTNLFDSFRHYVKFRTVEVGIHLIGTINFMDSIITAGINFAQFLRRVSDFSIGNLVYLSVLRLFPSGDFGFGFPLFTALSESENIFQRGKTTQRILHSHQWCSSHQT